MADAGILGMMRRTGYLRFHRSAQTLEKEIAKEAGDLEAYGVNFRPVDARELAELEPHLRGPHSRRRADAGAGQRVGSRRASARPMRATWRIARGASCKATPARWPRWASGWQVRTSDGPVAAPAVVVALGPWSDDICRPLGFPPAPRQARLSHALQAPRATPRCTGGDRCGETARANLDGQRHPPYHRRRVRTARCAPEPGAARPGRAAGARHLPLGERVDAQPWLGRRPCLPDMLPIVGRAPKRQGLWLNFGHHHLRLALGPVTGRLLAEMITGEPPFTDPTPYRADRF